MFNEMFFYKTMGSVLEYFGDSKKVHNFLGYILIYGLIILSATFSLSGSLQLGIATLAFGYFMYIMLFVYDRTSTRNNENCDSFTLKINVKYKKINAKYIIIRINYWKNS